MRPALLLLALSACVTTAPRRVPVAAVESAPLGGEEASAPVASLGTWVPVQVQRKTLLGQFAPTGSTGLAGNGSASAPSFAFASDSNTGLYRVGADEIGIATGGTLGWSQDSSQMLKCNKAAGAHCAVINGTIWVTDNGSHYYGYNGASVMQFNNLGLLSTGLISSSVASGNNGLAVTTNGARIDVGAGANDYFYSDGTTVTMQGVLAANSGLLTVLGGGGNIQSRSPQGATQGFMNPYYGASLDGTPNDDSSAIGVRIGTSTVTDPAADVACFFNNTSQKACINLNGFYLAPVQTLTVATDGAGTAATATLTPTSPYVNCTCNDPDTCAITMGETGVQDGTTVEIIASTANACTFADSAGVSELSGALTLGQYDTLRLIYLSDRWVQIATTNN